MTTGLQLSLLDNNDPISLLMQEIDILRKQNDNVRRGLFARHTELANMVLKQQQEIDALKGIVPLCKHERPELIEMVLF